MYATTRSNEKTTSSICQIKQSQSLTITGELLLVLVGGVLGFGLPGCLLYATECQSARIPTSDNRHVLFFCHYDTLVACLSGYFA